MKEQQINCNKAAAAELLVLFLFLLFLFLFLFLCTCSYCCSMHYHCWLVGWLTEKWSLHKSSGSTSNTQQTLLHHLYMQEFTRSTHYCPLCTTSQYSTFFTGSIEQILSYRSSFCCCSIHTVWLTGIEPHIYAMCTNQEFTNIIVPPCISLAVLLSVDVML